MSRHRNIRKLNVAEEFEEDDDADYLGRSMDDDDDDGSLSLGTSKFVNQRPELTYSTTQQQQENSVAKTGDQKGSWVESKKQPSSIPDIEHLRIESKQQPSGVKPKSPPGKNTVLTTNTILHRLSPWDIALASNSAIKPRRRPVEAQQSLNIVIVGHVDAGKSTMVGHLLYLLGAVDNKTMHKYKQEATHAGKSSFAFAWILDEGEQERNRGITMDIARATFKSQQRTFNILDAPGHRDFIPNMITGASQADAALLVVNSTRGEFETGFGQGGQTREHALLLRSLGVSSVIVAVNKMDTVDWSRERFEEVKDALTVFLRKQAGFSVLKFVPVSGLLGTNLLEKPENGHPLFNWYNESSLLDALDDLPLATQMLDELPLRIVVNDVLRLTASSVTLSGKLECGFVEAGDKLFIMPEANLVTVKAISSDGALSSPAVGQASKDQRQQPHQVFFAGDQVVMSASGAFEPNSIYPGHVLCRGGVNDLLAPTKHFLARIMLFDVKAPILKGTRAELFAHSLRVPCVVSKLRSVLDKATKEVVRWNPRILNTASCAMVEIQTDVPINIEPYSRCKSLGRFTLRANGQTIAAGTVDKAL